MNSRVIKSLLWVLGTLGYGVTACAIGVAGFFILAILGTSLYSLFTRTPQEIVGILGFVAIVFFIGLFVRIVIFLNQGIS